MAWPMSRATAAAEVENFILMSWSRKVDRVEVLNSYWLDGVKGVSN
jgi:hypothetical protein